MPPILGKRHRPTKNPVPIGWFDLPLDMRKMVIDGMDPKTRCKFAQCSKWCEKEAKESRHYLYKVGVVTGGDWSSQLHIAHIKESVFDFFLEFIDARNNQTIVAYRSHTIDAYDGGTVQWSKIEAGEPNDVRLKYLNEYVEKYKHCVRKFEFDDEEEKISDYNISKLENLEELVVIGPQGTPNDLASKVKKQWSFGYYTEWFPDKWINGVDCGFIDIKQLAHIKKLNTPGVEFTFEQFLKFNGETASIICADRQFSKKNLLKYLKMLQNGKIQENIRFVKIEGIDEDEIDSRFYITQLKGEEGNISDFSFRSENRIFKVRQVRERLIEITSEQTDSPRPIYYPPSSSEDDESIGHSYNRLFMSLSENDEYPY